MKLNEMERVGMWSRPPKDKLRYICLGFHVSKALLFSLWQLYWVKIVLWIWSLPKVASRINCAESSQIVWSGLKAMLRCYDVLKSFWNVTTKLVFRSFIRTASSYFVLPFILFCVIYYPDFLRVMFWSISKSFLWPTCGLLCVRVQLWLLWTLIMILMIYFKIFKSNALRRRTYKRVVHSRSFWR